MLTLLGGFAYSPLAVGFFIRFAGLGMVSLQFTVFFLSDMGVIGCLVMMRVSPNIMLPVGSLCCSSQR